MKNQKINNTRIRNKCNKIFLLLFLLFALSLTVSAAPPSTKIHGSGTGWTQPIDSTNLISGAGSDLTGSYQSATDTATLAVTCDSTYRIWVRRADVTWDVANFSLYVIRTNDGTAGTGSITSPAIGVPVLVTTGDTLFFSGDNSLDGITVQYQLSGMSLNSAPNSYRTSVIFSITSP